MTSEKKSVLVTRGEFYPVIGGIYSVLAFAVLGLIRHEEKAVFVIGYMLLFLAAVIPGIGFSWYGLNERRRQMMGPAKLGEADRTQV